MEHQLCVPFTCKNTDTRKIVVTSFPDGEIQKCLGNWPNRTFSQFFSLWGNAGCAGCRNIIQMFFKCYTLRTLGSQRPWSHNILKSKHFTRIRIKKKSKSGLKIKLTNKTQQQNKVVLLFIFPTWFLCPHLSLFSGSWCRISRRVLRLNFFLC